MRNKNFETEKTDELKKLVLTRIDLMPPDFKLSVGDQGTLTKEQLIGHVQKNDETGRQIMDMQMNFIKALTTGKLTSTLTG